MARKFGTGFPGGGGGGGGGGGVKFWFSELLAV